MAEKAPRHLVGGHNQSETARFISSFKPELPSSFPASVERIATSMVESAAKVKPGQKVLLWFDPNGLELVQAINKKCLEKGAEVSYFMRDLDVDVEEVGQLKSNEVVGYFSQQKKLMEEAENVIIVRAPENPEALAQLSKANLKAYEDAYEDVHKRRSDGTVEWSLVYWPTRYEADKEKVSYDDYFRMFIEACDQPWDEIKAAQEILVNQLDQGKTLELFANEKDEDPERRTHVSMSIENMTFCNSTVDRNYPGSEVFSAPVMESVNGQIFAEGEYVESGHLMKNIHFKIKDGRIMEDSYAEEGNEGFQDILRSGEGARYFGEVALGTNPGLTKRFFNALLNEKVGGSFHMAVGHCYEFDEYNGKKVKVNNGNTLKRTPIHWDVTIPMHSQYGGGKMVLGGETIQENGKFIDQRLSVLNPKI